MEIWQRQALQQRADEAIAREVACAACLMTEKAALRHPRSLGKSSREDMDLLDLRVARVLVLVAEVLGARAEILQNRLASPPKHSD